MGEMKKVFMDNYIVKIHLVGDGPELENYKKIVTKYNLSKNVLFYGALSGEKLDEVFNKSNIAVCSLGCHRINIFSGSFLKSREYLARGLPIVSSTKIDIIPENFDACLYVSEDETPIDISLLISFYEKLLKKYNQNEISRNIRVFAENNCGMTVAMKEVGDYIQEMQLKRGYYIAQVDKDYINNKTIGISKKIYDQIDYLNGINQSKCEYISFSQKKGIIKNFLNLFKSSQYDCYFDKLKNADFFYIRAVMPCSKSLITFFKKIKNKNPNCKILWEIPTYPYDKEMKTVKEKIYLFFDKLYRRKLKSIVDRIVTLTDDKVIWGVPTFHIRNGIDVSRIPIVNNTTVSEKEINLIAVAQFKQWHGYDRLLEGLHNYYCSGRQNEIHV